MNKTKRPNPALAMVETAFLASATGMIFLVNFFFPLGPFLRMFFPIPTALAYLRWGSKSAWKTMVVTVLLLTVLMGPTRSIQYAIPHGFLGVLLGFLWKRRSPWSLSLSLGTVTGTFGTLFQLLFLSVLLGENVWTYATVQITSFISWLIQLFGSLDEPDLWVVQVFIIGAIIFSNFMYMLLVHLVAWMLLDRLGNPIPPAPKWLEEALLV
jgi:uncharacterized protein YybS (DUF2232 family)